MTLAVLVVLAVAVLAGAGGPDRPGPFPGLAVSDALAFRLTPAVTHRARLRHAHACRPRGGAYRRHATRRRRAVALTFDDGPSRLTPAFLALLARLRVPATFFVVGRNVPGRRRTLRKMVRAGHAVGDHTLSHAPVAGGGAFAVDQVRAGANIVGRATGSRPCLFRAPYGAVSRRLLRVARRQHMETIGWDVDPDDWALPGAAAIADRVLTQVRAGSVVILHDGGGPRGQTLRALPRLVRVLRRRGYRFRTVPQLLGYR